MLGLGLGAEAPPAGDGHRDAEARALVDAVAMWRKRVADEEHTVIEVGPVQVAYHEAGHCVFHLSQGELVHYVTIVPDETEGSLGCCVCGEGTDTRINSSTVIEFRYDEDAARLLNYGCASHHAGPVAQELVPSDNLGGGGLWSGPEQSEV